MKIARLLLLIVLVAGGLMVQNANADIVTYEYQGLPFTEFFFGPLPQPGNMFTNGSVAAAVSVDWTPGVPAGLTASSWAITVTGIDFFYSRTHDECVAFPALDCFLLSSVDVSATGEITNWNLIFIDNLEFVSVTSSLTGDRVNAETGEPGNSALNHVPGTWSVPELPSVVLLGLALAGLGLMYWFKNEALSR